MRGGRTPMSGRSWLSRHPTGPAGTDSVHAAETEADGHPRPLAATRTTDDPVAIERVYEAVRDAERAATDGDGREHPTVAGIANAADLAPVRTFLTLAVLLDAGTVKAVRRSDGPLGFGVASAPGREGDSVGEHR